ncbi:hypothetical protein C8J57DRAFT_1287754 [Mycena rebaudengoi]|nr:hypothetical protein C8J57DRAFT_1287754 [Mycena rebaudengoi]
MDSQNTLKQSHGRGMNTQYKLPADRTEMEAGLYPSTLDETVHQVLEPNAEPRTILDCRAIEMAELYPNAHVVGVDLARNFQLFIQMDITKGLPPCRNPAGYDIIHARCLTAHTPQALLRLIYDALRPGGLLFLADPAMMLVDDEKKELVPRFPSFDTFDKTPASGSWLDGWKETWRKIIIPNHQRINSLVDENGKYHVLYFNRYFCPINWAGDNVEHGEQLGELMFMNIQQFIAVCKRAVLVHGQYAPQVLDDWVAAIEHELNSTHIYMAWDFSLTEDCE